MTFLEEKNVYSEKNTQYTVDKAFGLRAPHAAAVVILSVYPIVTLPNEEKPVHISSLSGLICPTFPPHLLSYMQAGERYRRIQAKGAVINMPQAHLTRSRSEEIAERLSWNVFAF